METLATFIDSKNENIRAVIVPDYDTESPREWDNTCIFHFKDDRQYKLPQEADDIIEWEYHDDDNEYDDEEFKKEKKAYLDNLNDQYYIFGMYYMNYSSAGSLFFKECSPDNEKMVGLALVKKGESPLTGYVCDNSADAKTVFINELENFQQWNEGETFCIHIEQLQTWTNEDTKETKEEWEIIYSCYRFHGSTYEEYKQAIKDIRGDEFNF